MTMHEALSLLHELEERDIDWLLREGDEQQVIAETAITEEGKMPDALYIVLQGLLGVRLPGVEGHHHGLLGPGEIVGEISFLEDQPASASVMAIENTLLLAVPRQVLKDQLAADPVFASRLYRAFAILSSRRLRERVGDLGLLLRDREGTARVADDVWSTLSTGVEEFKELIRQADQVALTGEPVPKTLQDSIVETFLASLARVNELIGDASGLGNAVREELGARMQRELLPYMLLSRTGDRFYAKPRGYAGDFMTIEQMYLNQPTGSSRVGEILDRCFLETPTACAVRNRRGLLAEEIGLVLERKKEEETRIMSLACGPAAEVFDVYEGLDDPSRLRATLLDIDYQALAFVSDRLQTLKLQRYVRLENANLVYLATGRQQMKVDPQDLVYSIGLIDYFNDDFVVKLLGFIHGVLAPGGKVVLGNFHPSSPMKAAMDYLVDWRMIHRTEEDMNRLFSLSAFQAPCTEIRYEDQKINLFACGIKH